MDHFRQDVRHAVRRLFKAPGFAVVAIVTLGLGIGANSAIFSVVNGVLLEPLPFPEPNRLVGMYHVWEGHREPMSGPNFIDATRFSTSLESTAAVSRERKILTGEGEPVRLDVARVSASFFSVLRAKPALGRTFAPDESTPGRTNVAVLSNGLWQQRFGSDPRAIGRRIQLDGVSTEIVGVMPAGFSFPADGQAWQPLEYNENFVSKQRGAWYLSVIARLKPGVRPEQAAAELQTIGRNLAKQYPDANDHLGMTTLPLQEAMVSNIREAVLVLLGAVGFVLLIACANVANLLLARAAARESEMAVRTALGAGRMRLIRQLLTESVILSICGAGMGLLFAIWGVAFLTSLQPQGVPRLDAVQVDGTVIGFTLAIGVLTGLVFGLVPAIHATRAVPQTLREAGRGAVTGRAGARARGTLVAVEMALAVMLLAGAGLLIRSFARLQAVDPGFKPEQTLSFELTLPDSRYKEDPKRIAFFDQLLPRLQALPGVRSVGTVMGLPLSGMNFNISFEVAGRPPVPPADQPAMEVRVASPDYFSTVGIPLERGRFYTSDDREGAPQVVVISDSAARQYFPNEDPIGKSIKLGWGKGGPARAGGRIVGVVGDVKDSGLDEANPPEIYLPLRQWPVSQMAVVIRTTTPPAMLAETVRTEVHAVDPTLPLSNVRTLDEIVAKSISQPRFYMTLLAIFAGVALALAGIGIFGVLSYAVAQRTREIGIRMALGARESNVVSLVVRQAMTLALVGVCLGTVAALLLSQTMTRMLFSVKPTDPMTFGAVAAVLIGVALLASYLPARRATRVDPIVALRAE
jgi:predicted permease